MKAGVPMSVPGLVGRMLPPALSACRASPKSMTFSLKPPSGSASRKTLPGFRSRCTTPTWCAAWSADSSSSRMAPAVRTGTGASRAMKASSGSPSSRSITMYGCPERGSVPKPKMSTMPGWRMALTVRASRTSRCTISGSSA